LSIDQTNLAANVKGLEGVLQAHGIISTAPAPLPHLRRYRRSQRAGMNEEPTENDMGAAALRSTIQV
jgi:hypothetical protein